MLMLLGCRLARRNTSCCLFCLHLASVLAWVEIEDRQVNVGMGRGMAGNQELQVAIVDKAVA